MFMKGWMIWRWNSGKARDFVFSKHYQTSFLVQTFSKSNGDGVSSGVKRSGHEADH